MTFDLVASEALTRVLTVLHECTIFSANDTLDSLEGGIAERRKPRGRRVGSSRRP